MKKTYKDSNDFLKIKSNTFQKITIKIDINSEIVFLPFEQKVVAKLYKDLLYTYLIDKKLIIIEEN